MSADGPATTQQVGSHWDRLPPELHEQVLFPRK